MRGEQKESARTPLSTPGSPPRARGAAVATDHTHAVVGITPACAGSRPTWAAKNMTYSGSPPRARGAGWHHPQRPWAERITPACAGSSRTRAQRRCPGPDHPRVRGEQEKMSSSDVWPTGSPPRARGAGDRLAGPDGRQRITPACAGSSSTHGSPAPRSTDHPRVRGEQSASDPFCLATSGSPPRARGAVHPRRQAVPQGGITPACAGSRRSQDDPRGAPFGITPACAGSRDAARWPRPGAPDHPRVRGEQEGNLTRGDRYDGSPPRARGAGEVNQDDVRGVGITPACAGSRVQIPAALPCGWDHPRVRGEQVTSSRLPRATYGSPPRARGAEIESRRPRGHSGITPACAGSRGWGRVPFFILRDHPRVRGEQAGSSYTRGFHGGSPPRARGAGRCISTTPNRQRITPACAGSRPTSPAWPTSGRDHPRVRGEQDQGDIYGYALDGSPPRARGAASGSWPLARGQRITPACAGSSRSPDRRRRRHPGSPPRARGADRVRGCSRGHCGITPACAGSRLPDLQR